MPNPTDFTWKHLLYRLFDADDVLLYIGRTNDLKTRFAKHARVQPWWPDVARSSVETHQDFAALSAAEKAAIIAEKPVHNIVWNGRVLSPREESGNLPPWMFLSARLTAGANALHEQCRINMKGNYPEITDEMLDAEPPCFGCALDVCWLAKVMDAAEGRDLAEVERVWSAIVHEGNQAALADPWRARGVWIGPPNGKYCPCASCQEGWAAAQPPLSIVAEP